jgi:hypothetical protein
MSLREDPLIRSRDVLSRAAAVLSLTGAPARAKLNASVTSASDLLSRSRATARAEAGAATAARAAALESEALVLNARRRLVQLARLAREALAVVDSSWSSGGGVNGGGSPTSSRGDSGINNSIIFEALRSLNLEPDEPIEDIVLPFAVGAPVRARARLAAAAAQRTGSSSSAPSVRGAFHQQPAPLPSSSSHQLAPNDDSLLIATEAICERLEEFARAEMAHHALLARA